MNDDSFNAGAGAGMAVGCTAFTVHLLADGEALWAVLGVVLIMFHACTSIYFRRRAGR